MESSSSYWMMKITFILLISMTIAFNVQSAEGRRILKRKSVQDKFLAQLTIVKEEHSGLELNILPVQSLSESKQMIHPVKKNTLLQSKLPSGGSPGTGNAYINDGGVKIGGRAESILKNILPSSGSPGVGH